MKTVVVKECGAFEVPCTYQLDLTQTAVKGCLGCWNCWWTNPGRCVHKDLDEFYRHYIAADRVIIFAKVTKGLVSANFKNLLDRIIPLALPYVTILTGKSRHLPRYNHYPDIQLYYEGEFATSGDKALYEGYIRHTFDLFFSQNISVRPIAEFKGEGAGAA